MRVVPPMTLRSRSLCKSIGAEAFVHIRIMKGRGEKKMANDKKLVEAITSMEEDFAQWYTDVVKKAELIDYTSVK